MSCSAISCNVPIPGPYNVIDCTCVGGYSCINYCSDNPCNYIQYCNILCNNQGFNLSEINFICAAGGSYSIDTSCQITNSSCIIPNTSISTFLSTTTNSLKSTSDLSTSIINPFPTSINITTKISNNGNMISIKYYIYIILLLIILF
jgi:hypothetical protein